MSRSKNPQHDMERLLKSMSGKNFQSKEELEKYMDQFVGRPIDEIIANQNQSELTDEEKSEELVYRAYEAPGIEEADELITLALKLNPKNSMAYLFLAEREEDAIVALGFYGCVLDLDTKKLGKKFIKVNTGHFWLIHETRTLMRAKAGLAECFVLLGEKDKAIAHYQDMLGLNHNDNQGVRYLLLTLLLEENKSKEIDYLFSKYPDDASASFAFSKALMAFKKEGATEEAYHCLQKASEVNEFIINYLLGFKKMSKKLPEYIGFGDENEAIMYMNDAGYLWKDRKIQSWLLECKEKLKKR